MERGQTGEPLGGQHLMLVYKKPDLPGTGITGRDDSGFDKNGVRAVTGADGQAKLTVPAADRQLYLSRLGDKPNKFYRVDAVAKRNTGAVRELARNAKPDSPAAAANAASVITETFKIGNRTFERRLYLAAYSEKVNVPKEESDDWCRVVEPAPVLDEADYPSTAGRDLPEAALKLLPTKAGRHAP